MDKIIRYWDSDCYLGWFNAEPDKIDLCCGVLTKAKKGELKIVSSSITLIEVIRIKDKPRLPKEKEITIVEFFQNDFITLRNVDRFIAEQARNLIWTYDYLKPKDSIHDATAISNNIQALNSFDDHLLKLDGLIDLPNGKGKLVIEKPHIPHQGDMFEDEKPKQKKDKPISLHPLSPEEVQKKLLETPPPKDKKKKKKSS